MEENKKELKPEGMELAAGGLRDTNDLYCPACASPRVVTVYDDYLGEYRHTCQSCGYNWIDQCH